MKRRTLAIAFGVLAIAGIGAGIAVADRGHRHGMGGHGMGGGHHGMFGDGGDRDFRRGRMAEFFRGPITKDDYDTRTRERFAAIDKNSDGVLDTAEIEAAITARAGRGREMMERLGERIRGRLDADRDGKVTKAEFMDRVRKHFAELDLDSDGRITDADLPPMMRGRGVLSGEGGGFGGWRGRGKLGLGEPGGVIFGADANKDGIVTLDEALAAAEKRFAELDRTKDGVLDKADGEALRKEVVDYRVKRFLHHFGASKDGKVTREQFSKKAAERFAEMDLNNDGRITRDELPGRGGWHGRHRGMMGGEHGLGDGGGPRRSTPRGGERPDGERRL